MDAPLFQGEAIFLGVLLLFLAKSERGIER